MPKRHQREPKRHLIEENTSKVPPEKSDQRFVLEIVVGLSNVKRWNHLKITFSCTTDQDFATYLLDLAEAHLKEKQNNEIPIASPKSPLQPQVLDEPDEPHVSEFKTKQPKIKRNDRKNQISRKRDQHKFKRTKTKRVLKIKASRKSETNLNDSELSTNIECLSEGGRDNLGHNSPKHLPQSNDFQSRVESPVLEDNRVNSILGNKILIEEVTGDVDKDTKSRKSRQKNDPNFVDSNLLENYLPDKQKKRTNGYDVRKAPELNKQTESKLDAEEVESLKTDVQNRVAIKIKLCSFCGTRHIQDQCPLQNPHYVVEDSLSYDDFLQNFKTVDDKMKVFAEDDADNCRDAKVSADEDNLNQTYAYMSLPTCLCLSDSNTSNDLSVFSNVDVKEYTQFGPLLGKVVKEVDIPEDFNMKQLWEIYSDKVRVYVNTENGNESNWIRFVRPAPTRDERNVIAVSKNSQLFLITNKNIMAGEELLYWQDDIINTNKKKMEKTSCGGCNITFVHPLYYRTHCSIFHDLRYSLTIRKYHCKVCGAAVLGKENIMKHAAELHNGQGAYQCQFCKKFFLRLNYLEMHRTYGCSANPHRSRPLCDFCGRKFCQPQKLKVHIKRMHSDLSEVLKEFQCKSCLKLLGSRAALQRHMKEVHNKQINGSCACSRCGKLFQNKSNLKIHMLTHSGIKPFRCAEGTCNAAFTTKQCLQFHYKKVHAFTDDRMPKIKRSVDYTFEAYSGDHDQELEDQDGELDKSADYNSETNYISANAGTDDDSCSNLEDRTMEDPPALTSPVPITTEPSSGSSQSPPTLEPYTNLKILSKGSKKWLGEQPLPTLKPDIYHLTPSHLNKNENSDINLEVDDSQTYGPAKLNINLNSYSRHESSNASLLVEAALDSVTDIHCSESNMNINVDSAASGTDVLVNNLCTLTHPETITDVSYAHSVDIGESRDINLISPSVNDPISVTDGENLRIDYSSFHHNDFSPANSPTLHHRSSFSRDYIDVGQVSPHDVPNYTKTAQSKHISPDSSPPRYNFGHGIGNEHISSDDSNGIGAQNLSLHDAKNDAQLDLSIYKSPYNLDLGSFQFRKDFGIKFGSEAERKMYVLEFNETSKIYHETTSDNNLASESSDRDQVEDFDSSMCNKDFENIDDDDLKHKNSELKTKYHDVDQLSSDIRNKQYELDLNLRSKSYEVASRGSYDGVVDVDFRLKNYDSVENTESRNNLPESEFRLDRNFEPLVLNSAELQGLDMTARSYHNYHSSTAVPNLNRYHHMYPDVDRSSVDLRLNYSPPLPSYTHADVLRVVSLDLTSPGRHSVDLSLRSTPLHVHQLGNSRLLGDHNIQTNRILTDHNRLTLDQSRLLSSDPTRLLSSDLATNRHLNTNSRLLSVPETGNRVLSDHSTNRLLSNEQLTNHLISPEPSRLISDDSRLLQDQPRILEQSRLLTESRILSVATGGSISPLPYSNYSVSPTPYHPTALTSRSHTNSPTPPYHHYSNYY